ncbi:MAG: DNA-binding protein [Desulfobulbus propionicus]|nr:MAG: DNA-binding protein [Desulfobulbus propionicus]
MPRPRKTRFVTAYPGIESFVPRDVAWAGYVCLTVEEFETIRLSDYEGLDQETAASRMGVSRHTYGRLLSSARSAVAKALVTGKELRIGGGHFEYRGPGKQRRHRGPGGGGSCRRQGGDGNKKF